MIVFNTDGLRQDAFAAQPQRHQRQGCQYAQDAAGKDIHAKNGAGPVGVQRHEQVEGRGRERQGEQEQPRAETLCIPIVSFTSPVVSCRIDRLLKYSARPVHAAK